MNKTLKKWLLKRLNKNLYIDEWHRNELWKLYFSL